MSVPETGETTAEMNRRGDNDAWPKIEAILKAGGKLRRGGHGLPNYYTEEAPTQGGFFGAHVLTASRVKKLERDGVLALVGVQTYALKGRPV